MCNVAKIPEQIRGEAVIDNDNDILMLTMFFWYKVESESAPPTSYLCLITHPNTKDQLRSCIQFSEYSLQLNDKNTCNLQAENTGCREKKHKVYVMVKQIV